jgi:hypothetical protein
MTVSQLVDGEWRYLTDEEHHAECMAKLVAAGIADPCPACFTPRVGGVCKPCTVQAVFNADPDYREWSDAQARLDFGGWAPDSDQPYTFDDATADKATVARLEAKFARAERDAKTDPGACALCGAPERGHAQRWHPHAGFEPFFAPSDALRKARMVARRNVRLGRPAWAPLDCGDCPEGDPAGGAA